MRSLLVASERIALKQETSVIPFTRWIIGKWRMYWNYCPECNSNAPKIHTCPICNADTKSQFHWTKEIEVAWWHRYTQKHSIQHANGHTVGIG